jgi:hypothetical protein
MRISPLPLATTGACARVNARRPPIMQCPASRRMPDGYVSDMASNARQDAAIAPAGKQGIVGIRCGACLYCFRSEASHQRD